MTGRLRACARPGQLRSWEEPLDPWDKRLAKRWGAAHRGPHRSSPHGPTDHVLQEKRERVPNFRRWSTKSPWKPKNWDRKRLSWPRTRTT